MKKTKKISIKYPLGHSYNETYCKDSIHCPFCGKQEVWLEQGDGDYYYGSTEVCLDCGQQFTIQLGSNPVDTHYDERVNGQRLTKLREALDLSKEVKLIPIERRLK